MNHQGWKILASVDANVRSRMLLLAELLRKTAISSNPLTDAEIKQVVLDHNRKPPATSGAYNKIREYLATF